MSVTRNIPFRPRFLLILAINAALLGFGYYALAGTRNIRVAHAQPPNIVATKADILITDDGDGIADPGETIRYVVIISNTQALDADSVVFTDTIDFNTALNGTFMSTPIARNDSYATISGTLLSIPAGTGLLVNDSDPDGQAISFISMPNKSYAGGDVSINADGSFTYNPPPGFEGGDSFLYTIQDTDGNLDYAIVSITVTSGTAMNTIWDALASLIVPVRGFVDGLATGLRITPALASGEIIAIQLDTLNGGQVVIIAFDVTVDSPFPSNLSNVCNQALISGTNFVDELTDDPRTSGSPDPTCRTVDTTPMNTPPSSLLLSLDSTAVDENGSVDLSAGFDDPDTQDTHSAMIDWGDGSSTTVNLTGDERAFSASHQYPDDNTFTVSVTVTDSANQSASASTSIVVNNVAPEVGAIAAPLAPVNINDPIIDFTVVFTDPGVLDTHTALWDWGDGASTAGTITGSDGSGIVSDSHTYLEAGVYAVTLTVEDEDFSSGQSEPQFIVIYDPNAGFVTGGGWIDSPSGAYAPDPSLAGKATFGFVSKYKKGAEIPDGTTEFQFKVANLNFYSSSYDWLVIAGHKAMYKGVGTINGSGNLGFLLSATDADLAASTEEDLFRIKIWDIDNGDKIIYDNQVVCSDTADDAEPCAQIGGGSIVIHKGKQK